jgi:hypothetical protein
MKKTFYFLLTAILVISIFTVTAFAVSFKGKIWTGKPGALGIGYYCTAAQNNSGQTTIDRAAAKCYSSSGACTSQASTTGKSKAIANNGSTRPNKGWGRYWQAGTANSSSASFSSSAWN